jgi:hypothetical protein
VKSQALKLLGRNAALVSSQRVRNTNGQSQYERSNRFFDFYLSRQSRTNFMVWEVYFESGNNLLLSYVS